MPYIPCNEYIGENVFLIFYNSVTLAWVVEEVEVSDGSEGQPYGMIFRDVALDVDQPYWVGKNFESVLKTLPLVSPGQTGKKARASELGLYVLNSQGGVLETDNGTYNLVYPSTGDYTGKIDTSFGGEYTEEPQFEITTDEIYNLRILAMEFNYRRMEK